MHNIIHGAYFFMFLEHINPGPRLIRMLLKNVKKKQFVRKNKFAFLHIF